MFAFLSSKIANIWKYVTMDTENKTWKLDPKDLDFLASYTDTSREDVENMYKEFLEKSSDGKITKEGFKTFMGGLGITFFIDNEKLDSLIFRLFDSDGDGNMDFKEFWMVMYIMSEGSREQKLKQIFHLYDLNNDQKVSQDELKKVIKVMLQVANYKESKAEKMAEGYALAFFVEMDTNEDGEITEEEFMEACLKNEMISDVLVNPFTDLIDSSDAASDTDYDSEDSD